MQKKKKLKCEGWTFTVKIYDENRKLFRNSRSNFI